MTIPCLIAKKKLGFGVVLTGNDKIDDAEAMSITISGFLIWSANAGIRGRGYIGQRICKTC